MSEHLAVTYSHHFDQYLHIFWITKNRSDFLLHNTAKNFFSFPTSESCQRYKECLQIWVLCWSSQKHKQESARASQKQRLFCHCSQIHLQVLKHISLALCVSNPSRVGELVHAGQCLIVGLPSAKAITVKQNFLSEFHKCLISDVHF